MATLVASDFAQCGPGGGRRGGGADLACACLGGTAVAFRLQRQDALLLGGLRRARPRSKVVLRAAVQGPLHTF